VSGDKGWGMEGIERTALTREPQPRTQDAAVLAASEPTEPPAAAPPALPSAATGAARDPPPPPPPQSPPQPRFCDVVFLLRVSGLPPQQWDAGAAALARLRGLLGPPTLPAAVLARALLTGHDLRVGLRWALSGEAAARGPPLAALEARLRSAGGAAAVARALLAAPCSAELIGGCECTVPPPQVQQAQAQQAQAQQGAGAPRPTQPPPDQPAPPVRLPVARPGGALLLTEREHLDLLGWAPRHLSASELESEEGCRNCLEGLGAVIGAICAVVAVLGLVLACLGGGAGGHIPTVTGGGGGGGSAAAQPQRQAITLRLCGPALWAGALAGAALAVALSGAPLALRLLLLALPLALGAARSARWLLEDCRGARTALELERPTCPDCRVCCEAAGLAVMALCSLGACALLAVVLPPLGLTAAAVGAGVWAWMPFRPSPARRLALRLAALLLLAALTLAAANWRSFAADVDNLLRRPPQQQAGAPEG
jgi:hypothetical protein